MSRRIKKTVEEYLDEVSYSFDNYIPSIESLMFVNFIKEVNGGLEENETPIMHMQMMDQVFTPDPRAAIMVHRGGSKTTIFAEYLTLWKACFNTIPGFGRTNLSLYITDSIENGVKSLRRNVEFRYQNSEYLQWMLPVRKLSVGSIDGRRVELEYYEEAIHDKKGGYKFTDIRLEFENRKGGRHITKSYGVMTGVRGTKELGQRPVDATFDDLIQGDDAARSEIILQSVRNTIYSDVGKALHPKKRKMIYLGTPYNKDDPLYQAIESGMWNSAVFPIAEFFDGTTTREEFRGSWEDRFGYDYVKDEYELAISTGNPRSFYQELMLRVVNKDDLLLDDDDIVFYDSVDQILYAKDNFNFYITTDFAVTAKASADNSTISVWAYDNNDILYWIDGFSEKCTIDVSLKALFEFVALYNPFQVGIERSGQQGAIVTMVETEMQRRGAYFNLAREKGSKEAGLNSTKDKVTRLNSVVPMFKQKRIRFPKDKLNTKLLKTGLEQIRGVSNKGYASKHDDFGDTVAMLSKMKLIRPSIEKAIPIQKERSRLDMLFDESDMFEEKRESILNNYLGN